MRGWIVGLMAASLVAIALAVAALVLLRPGDDTIVLDLDAGDCFQVPDDIAEATISKVDTIDCAKPHEAEVFATGQLDPDRDQPYPDDEQQLFARVDRQVRGRPRRPFRSRRSLRRAARRGRRTVVGAATAVATSASPFRTAAAPRKGSLGL